VTARIASLCGARPHRASATGNSRSSAPWRRRSGVVNPPGRQRLREKDDGETNRKANQDRKENAADERPGKAGAGFL
jgi:hypothetical protein